MILYLPPIIALIGLIIYIVSDKPKITEIGRIMLWTGLLATLLGLHK